MRWFLERFPSAVFPAVLALILLTIEGGSRLFGLPGPDSIVAAFEYAYQQYPGLVILLGAFLETVFMLSFYLPGSFVIFLAVYFSGKGGPTITEIIFLSSAGVFSGLCTNYVIGRFGLARFFRWLGADLALENMRKFMQYRRGLLTTFLLGAHPNFIGVAMVVNGMAKVPGHKALATGAAATIVWVPAMILVAAEIADELRESAGSAPYVIIFLLCAWAAVGAAYDAIRNAKRSNGRAPK